MAADNDSKTTSSHNPAVGMSGLVNWLKQLGKGSAPSPVTGPSAITLPGEMLNNQIPAAPRPGDHTTSEKPAPPTVTGPSAITLLDEMLDSQIPAASEKPAPPTVTAITLSDEMLDNQITAAPPVTGPSAITLPDEMLNNQIPDGSAAPPENYEFLDTSEGDAAFWSLMQAWAALPEAEGGGGGINLGDNLMQAAINMGRDTFLGPWMDYANANGGWYNHIDDRDSYWDNDMSNFDLEDAISNPERYGWGAQAMKLGSLLASVMSGSSNDPLIDEMLMMNSVADMMRGYDPESGPFPFSQGELASMFGDALVANYLGEPVSSTEMGSGQKKRRNVRTGLNKKGVIGGDNTLDAIEALYPKVFRGDADLPAGKNESWLGRSMGRDIELAALNQAGLVDELLPLLEWQAKDTGKTVKKESA